MTPKTDEWWGKKSQLKTVPIVLFLYFYVFYLNYPYYLFLQRTTSNCTKNTTTKMY